MHAQPGEGIAAAPRGGRNSGPAPGQAPPRASYCRADPMAKDPYAPMICTDAPSPRGAGEVGGDKDGQND